MLSFPNCKINLGLRILDKRSDGFHNIESVFYPVNWCDALEVIESESFEFFSAGRKVEGKTEDNSCVKAYRLLKDKYKLPPVKIFLLKKIPTGAGLGGGSSDGAFMLKLLNEKFRLNISKQELKAFASQLGSDCPFFIENKPVMATGRGEVLNEVTVTLNHSFLILIYPSIAVNTAWAYGELSKQRKTENGLSYNFEPLKEIIQLPVEKWNGALDNDFEKIIFHKHPEIEQIKNELLQQGAVYAAMSGSGSSVFGIFNKKISIKYFSDIYGKENVFYQRI